MNNIEQAISFARQEYTRQGLEALYQEGFETALLPCLPKAAEIFTSEPLLWSGDPQTDLLAALDAAREGDFEKAEQLHKDASDALIGAHDTQTKLLSQEAGGGEMEMTFIMAHAQDTLMTTMILEKQTRFTIDAYKRIAELEAKLA